jgi:hypothetical protein
MTRADDLAEMIDELGEDVRFRGHVIQALVGAASFRREYDEGGNFVKVRVLPLMCERARIPGGDVEAGEVVEYEGKRLRVREVATAEGCIKLECAEGLGA